MGYCPKDRSVNRQVWDQSHRIVSAAPRRPIRSRSAKLDWPNLRQRLAERRSLSPPRLPQYRLEPFPFRWNRNGLSILVLARFLYANRYPLRSKTLQPSDRHEQLEHEAVLLRARSHATGCRSGIIPAPVGRAGRLVSKSRLSAACTCRPCGRPGKGRMAASPGREASARRGRAGLVVRAFLQKLVELRLNRHSLCHHSVDISTTEGLLHAHVDTFAD